MTPNFRALCEGISLRCITTEKFKTGMLSLSVSMPRQKFTTPYNLLLSGIMRRGTQKYPTMAALNKRLDELYAATIEIKGSNYGDNKLFTLSCEMLDNAYAESAEDIADGVLELLYQIFLCPLLDENNVLPEKSVEQEKKIVADNLRATINNPRGYSLTRLFEIMNENDSGILNLSQSIATVEKVTSKEITEYYKGQIAPRHLEFFYVGSLSEKEISEKILKHFAPRKAKISPLLPAKASTLPQKARFVSEEMPISQGNLALGFRTGVCVGDKRNYSLILLNEILGASPTSKLFMNVREKMSLCYYCSSSYNIYSGNIVISSGIDPQNKDKAQKAILDELDKIRNAKITENEFNAAKKSLENWYRQIFDNPFDLFGFYSGRALFGIDVTVDECRRSLMELTLEDVVKAAEYIKLDTVYFLSGTKEGGESNYDE